MSRREITRVICGLVVVAILTWGGSVVGWATAGQRLSGDPASVEYPVAVQVDLDFRPSQFHRDILYRHGAYDGRASSERSIRLRRVSRESVEFLSRLYWIDRLTIVT